MDTKFKLERLHAGLERLGSAVLAFSGGVDSTFLARAAVDILGNRVLAVTAVSSFSTPEETREAVRLARGMRLRHVLLPFRPGRVFWDNPRERCYHCKKGLCERLRALARAQGLRHVMEASNADDARDHRPGRRALKESGVISPLEAAGLTKAEIRSLSRRMGLRTWDKPSAPCLATRIPYGRKITPRKLEMVRKAEAYLRKSGVALSRVRHHGEVARIETAPGDLAAVLRSRGRISARLHALGFGYVALDLDGYRSGAMDEVL